MEAYSLQCKSNHVYRESVIDKKCQIFKSEKFCKDDLYKQWNKTKRIFVNSKIKIRGVILHLKKQGLKSMHLVKTTRSFIYNIRNNKCIMKFSTDLE